ncbi:TF3B [Enterospora canceri]|uniref:B-related factor 1 n=1 Tax=Enterospora canceri TaxID=1081671 RepID=A0A1Y1S9M5_9MICR|nr:TF3B [Enterospora canceri]
MQSQCTNCGSTEMQTDSTRGIICCEECGMIQEENMIVNTIQFEKVQNKSALHGQIVNVENKNVGTKYVDSCYYIKNTIKNICAKLSLNLKHADIAFRWYKLCLANNLTKGKSILYTLSACIYISCRQENTPHMLIDFSNVLRIDMYQIGKIYLKIRNTFDLETYKIQNSMTDMSMYLHRFASQLKFRNTKEIILLSTRILSRMRKDWIMEGRKPNNACGAAILLASRILNEPKDVNEVARVVHAAPSTISKRLAEIAATETAAMDVNEFNREWLVSESQPPVLNAREGGKETGETRRILVNKVKREEEIAENSSEVVNEMILEESEVENKTKMWEEMYGEYVKESEKKKRNKKGMVKRSKKKHNFETVEEAFKSLDKKVSSKLNYSAINELFEN